MTTLISYIDNGLPGAVTPPGYAPHELLAPKMPGFVSYLGLDEGRYSTNESGNLQIYDGGRREYWNANGTVIEAEDLVIGSETKKVVRWTASDKAILSPDGYWDFPDEWTVIAVMDIPAASEGCILGTASTEATGTYDMRWSYDTTGGGRINFKNTAGDVLLANTSETWAGERVIASVYNRQGAAGLKFGHNGTILTGEAVTGITLDIDRVSIGRHRTNSASGFDDGAKLAAMLICEADLSRAEHQVLHDQWIAQMAADWGITI